MAENKMPEMIGEATRDEMRSLFDSEGWDTLFGLAVLSPRIFESPHVDTG
jgi:hypothetical protein